MSCSFKKVSIVIVTLFFVIKFQWLYQYELYEQSQLHDQHDQYNIDVNNL